MPLSFDLEITARCNNNCRHCYINLPADDKTAKAQELSFDAIKAVVDEALSLGALWCLITGGEPLLRDDFIDIYRLLKEKGILVEVFTNATLVTLEHVRLFKQYPPRNLEVTVYGTTAETYERVTRTPGSFDAFVRGLDLLLSNGIRVVLKAMALRSNSEEFSELTKFCYEKSPAGFRFDPFLHLRYDRNPIRNADIIAERLSPDEIAMLESTYPERLKSLKLMCDHLIGSEHVTQVSDHLFRCGAGNHSFTIGYNGCFRLCSSLWHPDCVRDLTTNSVTSLWENLVPAVKNARSSRQDFIQKCRVCPMINLCMWCPAHAHLETGFLDMPVDYFCDVANKRLDMVQVNQDRIKEYA
jgi:radical SAM protein with 4Fe4S-binding SPASM domain